VILGGNKGGCGARPSQGPGCDGVDLDNRWPSQGMSLWGLTELDSGVVHSPSPLKIRSVQRLLVGSLYPVRIVSPLNLT
jgi:hypothetical protein